MAKHQRYTGDPDVGGMDMRSPGWQRATGAVRAGRDYPDGTMIMPNGRIIRPGPAGGPAWTHYNKDKTDAGNALSAGVEEIPVTVSTYQAPPAPGPHKTQDLDDRSGSSRARTLGVTKILQYPKEPVGSYDKVSGVADNGHYILFYINVAAKTKVADIEMNFEREEGKRQSSKSKTLTHEAQANVISGIAGTSGLRRGDVVSNDIYNTLSKDINEGSLGARNANKTVGQDETLYTNRIKKSKRLSTAIALYMPPQVQTSYTLNYSDVDFGYKAQGLNKLFDVLGEEGGELHGTEVTSMARKAAIGLVNTLAPGAATGIGIKQGVVQSNKMELSFSGVARREFSFTFAFTPKSAQEAQDVESIISIFKYYSHPDFIQGSAGNMMTIPDSFDISYMYQGGQNSFINKISTCFCTNLQVQYGGDRFTAHTPTTSRHGAEGAFSPPPTKTILTMSFKELEILTKPRIDQGY